MTRVSKKKRKARKKKPVLVAVSSLALSAWYGSPAVAQLQISCTRRLYVGEHDICANGRVRILPSGGTSALTGCLITTIPPDAGKCVVSTGGVAITKSVLVAFTNTKFDVTMGGNFHRVNRLRMQHTGAAKSAKSFTFTPTEVSNTVTVNIGGRLRFRENRPDGMYVGTISVSATLQ